MAKEQPFDGPYDPDRQMFTRKNVTINSDVLIMWRSLAESGKLGRKPEGPPSGDLALAISIQRNSPIGKIVDHKMRQHLAANGDY